MAGDTSTRDGELDDDIYSQIRSELYPDDIERDGDDRTSVTDGGPTANRQREWFTLVELGEELQVSPNTLYKWRARGDFPAHTRLPNRQTRVHRDDLYAWMHRRRSS